MTDKPTIGEVPTTGAARPGPSVPYAPSSSVRFHGVRPIAIRIPSIQVDSEIERRPIIDGDMQDPTGPFIVAWYGATGRLGLPGNAVLAGHVDYAGVGPAVFARIGELVEGDRIELTGEDVNVYRYAVEWSQIYDADTAPVLDIIGATSDESVTLITCGGAFNAGSGSYSQRLIVRAKRDD
jgi:LPXTG-site transpeptidase (sortase) family protein